MSDYAAIKSSDTYRLYNPKTQKVIEHFEVQWLDWIRESVTNGLGTFKTNDNKSENLGGLNQAGHKQE